MSSIVTMIILTWTLTFTVPALPSKIAENFDGWPADYVVLKATYGGFSTKHDCLNAGRALRDVLAETYKQPPIIQCAQEASGDTK